MCIEYCAARWGTNRQISKARLYESAPDGVPASVGVTIGINYYADDVSLLGKLELDGDPLKHGVYTLKRHDLK